MCAFAIGGQRLEPGRCFVIAEAGVNHNGSLDLAVKLVEAAKTAGADAVKFQTFRAERLASARAGMAPYQRENTGASEGQHAMLRRLELSAEDHRRLFALCKDVGITFLSSPFDELAANFLEELGVDAFKIPSGEITNFPYLEHIARKGRPMIVSTGMATMAEVAQAVDAIDAVGAPPIALLHCTSDYPAQAEDVNLRAMSTLQSCFGVPAGYSDHTEGIAVSLAAAALGAQIIEKHFTLDRSLPGPDHKASLEPGELTRLVAGVRTIESALGDGVKRPGTRELETRVYARKSIVAVRDIAAGATIAPADLAMRRPGTGLAPAMLEWVIGLRATRPIHAGDLLSRDDLS